MTRLAGFAIVWAVFFALCIAYLAWLQFNGYESSSMLALSGDAILAAEGKTGFAEIATVYPPLPHLLAYAVAYLNSGVAMPAIIASAIIGGFFAACIFWALREAKTGVASALIVTTLLTANPLLLRALSDAPGPMLLLCSMLMFALGMFGLARDGTVQDVMAVAVALVLLAFSHHYGVVLAFAALPFLALSAPRDLVARAPGGLFLTLLFPIAFSLLAFAYVCWVFTDSAWAFLAQSIVSLDTPADGAAIITSILLACVAIGLASPILPALFVYAIGRQNLTKPALALAGTVLAAAALATATGSTPSFLVMLSPVIAIASACAICWPSSRHRGTARIAFATLGLIGGVVVVSSVTGTVDRTWRQAFWGQAADNLSDLRGVVAFLENRSDVLLDAKTHPDLVALRGTSRGLIVPSDPRFDLAMLTSRPTHRFVAMPDPASDQTTSDRVERAFPRMYNDGASNYHMVYDEMGWRVYGKSPIGKGGN